MNNYKASALLVSVLCAGCATPYIPPTEHPPLMWEGRSGWRLDGDSARVSEGVRQIGEPFLEHDAYLVRTGIVQETVQMKNAYGRDLIIPQGTKAFAMNCTLVTGYAQTPQQIDPIEWCMYLPHGIDGKKPGAETVCAFWENETRARYDQDFVVGGFAFLPRLYTPTGMPGVVPKIQPADVDFGVRFVHQVRVSKLTKRTIAFESVFSDGTSEKREGVEQFNLRPDGTFVYEFGGDAVVIAPAPDQKSVEVRRRTTS